MSNAQGADGIIILKIAESLLKMTSLSIAVLFRRSFGIDYLRLGFFSFIGLLIFSSFTMEENKSGYTLSVLIYAFIFLILYIYHHKKAVRDWLWIKYSGQSHIARFIGIPEKPTKVLIEPIIIAFVGFLGIFGPIFSSYLVISALSLFLTEAITRN